jgi:hypothetical protein
VWVRAAAERGRRGGALNDLPEHHLWTANCRGEIRGNAEAERFTISTSPSHGEFSSDPGKTFLLAFDAS